MMSNEANERLKYTLNMCRFLFIMMEKALFVFYESLKRELKTARAKYKLVSFAQFLKKKKLLWSMLIRDA